MYIKEVKMHSSSGRKVQLQELLEVLPENTFHWHILEFEGIGEHPDYTWCEFDNMLKTSPRGVEVSWESLLSFSQKIEDITDVLIVAVLSGYKVNLEQCRDKNYQGCEIVLNGQDSTYWELAAVEKDILDKLVKAALA